ncbi:hypothetical protein ABG858_22265, partial [Phocaeicola vulgatus]
MMNRYSQQSICMLKNMFVSRNIIKWVLFLILNFSLCTQSFADHYRVTAPNGLNVRASANKNGKLLGQLSKDNVIDVVSTSFPQLFYPLMTRQFFCDFHEKSED